MFQLDAAQPKKALHFKADDRCTRRTPSSRGRDTRTLGSRNPYRDPRIDAACRTLAPLVDKVAGRFARRLPSHVDLGDLLGAGAIGMLTAVQQHLGKPAEDLARLAERRIRGAILDHLRGNDHLSRRQRAAVSALARAKQELVRQGKDAGAAEVAGALGITKSRAETIEARLATVQMTSFDDSLALRSESQDPFELACGGETQAVLARALAELPERLRQILGLYYTEEMTYSEIGRLLKISRSRVCQLHTYAVELLRKRLMA